MLTLCFFQKSPRKHAAGTSWITRGKQNASVRWKLSLFLWVFFPSKRKDNPYHYHLTKAVRVFKLAQQSTEEIVTALWHFDLRCSNVDVTDSWGFLKYNCDTGDQLLAILIEGSCSLESASVNASLAFDQAGVASCHSAHGGPVFPPSPHHAPAKADPAATRRRAP
jgi:hypothetical protein